MKKASYIYAASANVWPAEPQVPDLKPLVTALWGKSYRRISHFIELALVGAKRCVDKAVIPVNAQCDLLFATGQGNVSQVVKVTRKIFREHEAPMPFDFMHITNNMAPFYVAQSLGVTSSNLTVAHRAFTFETAMDLAQLQMAASDRQCLIGAVDECAYPLSDHRRRLDLPQHAPLAEGSHWLLLGTSPQNAVAQIDICWFARAQQELMQRLRAYNFSAPVSLACGFGIDDEERQWWQQQLTIDRYYDYRRRTAYHDTAAAYAIASFVEQSANHTLVHINKSPQQRYCVLAVTVL